MTSWKPNLRNACSACCANCGSDLENASSSINCAKTGLLSALSGLARLKLNAPARQNAINFSCSPPELSPALLCVRISSQMVTASRRARMATTPTLGRDSGSAATEYGCHLKPAATSGHPVLAQRSERVDDLGLCRVRRRDRLDLTALDLDQHWVERGVVVEVVAFGCELDRSVEGGHVGAGDQFVQLAAGFLGQRRRLTQLLDRGLQHPPRGAAAGGGVVRRRAVLVFECLRIVGSRAEQVVLESRCRQAHRDPHHAVGLA